MGPERTWNNFDFWLVTICYIPIPGVNAAFLRLLRLIRLLKLVGRVKQLQVIVVGLIKGMGAVSYIDDTCALDVKAYTLQNITRNSLENGISLRKKLISNYFQM